MTSEFLLPRRTTCMVHINWYGHKSHNLSKSSLSYNQKYT